MNPFKIFYLFGEFDSKETMEEVPICNHGHVSNL
jgi:hypothetical protein